MNNIKNLPKRRGIKLTAILLVICLFTTIVASCKETNSITPAESLINSVLESEVTAANSTLETSVIETQSDVSAETSLPEVEKTPAQKIRAGEIRNDASNAKTIDEGIRPLVEWLCENLFTDYGTANKISFVGSHDFTEYDSYSLHYAYYKVTFINNGISTEKNVAVLYGTLNNSRNEYILIDGQVDKYYYSLDIYWNTIIEHAVFGGFANEIKKVTVSKGIVELDVASLIGKERNINLNIAINDTIVAVISTLNNADLKIDFIDITKSTLTRESYYPTDMEELGYKTSGNTGRYFLDDNELLFSLGVSAINDGKSFVAWYEVDLNSIDNISDKLTFNSDYYVQSAFPESLHSESGRYYVLYKNGDLYLHDNTTNNDILVYDSKPDKEGDYSLGVYDYAEANFFVGEILYFTRIGWEWSNGIGSYNTETNETILYKTQIGAEKYINGYVYGISSILAGDFYFGRININNTQNDEVLFNTMPDLETSIIIYSSNGKYIAQILHTKYYDDISLEEDLSTITIYDSSTFKLINSYTIDSIKRSTICSIFIGDYVYIFTNSNKAYLIKVN